MRKMFDFNKFFKKALIISGCLILAGVIATCVLGINFDITFVGGSRFTYSYDGDIKTSEVKELVKEKLGVDATVTESSDYSGESQKIVIAFSGDVTKDIDAATLESLLKAAEEKANAETEAEKPESETEDKKEDSAEDKTENPEETTEAEVSESMVAVKSALSFILDDNYPDSNIKLSESNTVNPTLAGSFFAKSIVAVVIAAAGVIIYIALRFRKIGGIMAGVASLIALVNDVIIAFFTIVVFGLDIDTNFFAVVLTLFGYSLNATIVIFDRVRENKKYYPELTVAEGVNRSINETLARSVVTSVTTFASIVAIIVVSELFGVTALRSFAIPMAVGVISGCYSSVLIAGPLWVKWSELKASKEAAKK